MTTQTASQHMGLGMCADKMLFSSRKGPDSFHKADFSLTYPSNLEIAF